MEKFFYTQKLRNLILIFLNCITYKETFHTNWTTLVIRKWTKVRTQLTIRFRNDGIIIFVSHPSDHLWNKFTKDPPRQSLIINHCPIKPLKITNAFKTHWSIHTEQKRRKKKKKEVEQKSHLGLGEVKGGREFGPLRNAEVLPFRELLLEREQLLRGERRPRLPVRLVFPQVALDLGRLPVLCNRKATGGWSHDAVIVTVLASHSLNEGGGEGKGKGTLFRGLRTNRGETPPTATSVFLRDAAQFQRKAKLFRDRFIIFPRRRRKLGPHLALFCAPTARSPTPSPTLVFIRYIALPFEAKGMYNRDNRYQFSRIIRHDRFGSIMDRRGNCVIAEIYQPTYLARGFFFSFWRLVEGGFRSITRRLIG